MVSPNPLSSAMRRTTLKDVDAEVFDRIFAAAGAEFITMIVFEKAFTVMTGPYSLPHLAKTLYALVDGSCSALPMIGNPAGPGGKPVGLLLFVKSQRIPLSTSVTTTSHRKDMSHMVW